MNNTIYHSYFDRIKDSLQYGQKRSSADKVSNFSGISGLGDIQNRAKQQTKIINKSNDEELFRSLQPLSAISGIKANYHLKPGAHPDFKHIAEDLVESHYITSVFIDIKNSTNLFKRYLPSAVANITSTIQRAAMHTCWYFNGYIQRFHGDGLMVYFGGKNISVKESINNALNAASFFSYFMEHDLRNLFLEQGVEKIFTRIGIDTGENEDVLWYQAGIGECSEVTTCSLHTSLAAKMQGYAINNGIVVGDNVKDISHLNNFLFNAVEERRYIFQIPEERFNYTQWNFEWLKFLKDHKQVKEDLSGNLFLSSTGINSNAASNIVVPTSALGGVDYLRSQAQGYKPYYRE